MKSSNDWVVITGAASGLGFAYANHFNQLGLNMLLIDKDHHEMIPIHQNKIKIISANLLNTSCENIILNTIKEFDGRLLYFINNAGIGFKEPIYESNFEKQLEIIALNCSMVVKYSLFAINLFKKNNLGFLINIGSSTSFVPTYQMATYGASKCFVKSFTLALASEINGMHNIRVLLVTPSGMKTNFQRAAQVNVNKNEKLMEPSYVVTKSLKALHCSKNTHLIVGFSSHLLNVANRLLPERILVYIFKYLMNYIR